MEILKVYNNNNDKQTHTFESDELKSLYNNANGKTHIRIHLYIKHTHTHIYLHNRKEENRRPKMLQILQNTHLLSATWYILKYIKTHKHTLYGGIYVRKTMATSRKLLCKGINHFQVENGMKNHEKLLKIYLYNS